MAVAEPYLAPDPRTPGAGRRRILPATGGRRLD